MSKLTEQQIEGVRRAHELAHEACWELVHAHREPGPATAFTPALQKASGELSAVCATLGAILKQCDEEAKTERWRQRLLEQNSGTRE